MEKLVAFLGTLENTLQKCRFRWNLKDKKAVTAEEGG